VADRLDDFDDPNHAFLPATFDTFMDIHGVPEALTKFDVLPTSMLGEILELEPGDQITFAVEIDNDLHDVTLTVDLDGRWRLRRLVPAGAITLPSPFPLPLEDSADG